MIVMQRLHKNDLAGHVLGPMKEEGRNAHPACGGPGTPEDCFPALGHRRGAPGGRPDHHHAQGRPTDRRVRAASAKEGRAGGGVIDDGGLLWPEREGPEEIAEVKLVMEKDAFAGQYQQRPAPLGGGMIERYWFRRYETNDAGDQSTLSLSLDTV